MFEGTYNFQGLSGDNGSTGTGENPAVETEVNNGTGEETGAASIAHEAAAPDEAKNSSLENVMGLASEETEPEAKPEEGKKTEGEKTDDAKKIPAWISQLPESMRSDEAFTAFEKIGDLAKAWKELADKGDGIPTKDAKPEELEAFYEKLGKPKTAEEYKLEGEGLDAYKAICFKSNLTQEQAAALKSEFENIGKSLENRARDSMKQNYANTDRELRNEYGNAYGERMQTLAKGLQTWGGKSVQEKLFKAGLSFDSDIVHMFIKLGDLAKESEASNKQGTGSTYRSNSEGGRFQFKGL